MFDGDISDDFENGSYQVKTRSPGQILETFMNPLEATFSNTLESW